MLHSLQSLHLKLDSLPEERKFYTTALTSSNHGAITSPTIQPAIKHDKAQDQIGACITRQANIQSASVQCGNDFEAEKPVSGNSVRTGHLKVNQSIRISDEAPKNETRSASLSKGSALSCLDDCPCRCHGRKRLRSPRALSNYVGDATMYLSNLPWCFSSVLECDEQTCRRSAAIDAVMRYSLPKWFSFMVAAFNVNITLKRLPIQFGIESPRTIPYCSPIFKCIEHGDLGGMQTLMVTHKTSVCDIDPYDLGLLYVSKLPVIIFC